MLNTVSAYLWGEECLGDCMNSSNREVKPESESHTIKMDSLSRKKVQSQMRKVHIEMWRENVRQSRQLREADHGKTKEFGGGERMERLQRIETRFMKELSRQIKFEDMKKGKPQITFSMPSNDNCEILLTSIDEVEDDYVLLVFP